MSLLDPSEAWMTFIRKYPPAGQYLKLDPRKLDRSLVPEKNLYKK